MFKTVHFKVTVVASLALAAAVFFSPYAMRLGEASCSLEPSPTATTTLVVGHSRSRFPISEEKVGKKTFTISRILINAAPARVWGVLTDYDGAAGIFSSLSKSELISSSGSTKLVNFSARSVGKLFNFDYTLEVTEKDSDLIEWKRVSGAFKANEGYWKLEPVDDGKKTLVTYAKYVDGGFFLSQVLVRKMIRDSIPVIFEELKGAAESPLLSNNKR